MPGKGVAGRRGPAQAKQVRAEKVAFGAIATQCGGVGDVGAAQSGVAAQQYHELGRARAHRLDGRTGQQVIGCETEQRQHGFWRVRGPEHRLALRHPHQRGLGASRRHYIDPNGAVEQVQGERERSAGGRQRHPARVEQGRDGGNGGVPGQRNLLGGREEAHREFGAAGCGPIHKGGFRLVELAGQALPHGGVQRIGIEHHGAGIPAQWLGSEGIDEQKG